MTRYDRRYDRDDVLRWVRTWRELLDDGYAVRPAIEARYGVSVEVVRRAAMRYGIEVPPPARVGLGAVVRRVG